MDIVVKGRNVEVPTHYRVHVEDKLTRMERYDRKVIRFDVELFHEPNRRQSKNCQRVEITGKGRGPAVRAEACAGDFYAALDQAVAKLENRLRRLHDRRRVHHGRRSPASVAEATSTVIGAQTNGKRVAQLAVLDAPEFGVLPELPEQHRWEDMDQGSETGSEVADNLDNLPGRVVREKEHPAKPMTVDQALYEMELVGHDFYLYADADSGQPSVVYRRRAFDYGVIKLV
jgi:ribosomal subunit interface protein